MVGVILIVLAIFVVGSALSAWLLSEDADERASATTESGA